jgi:hypothetical protein
MSKTYGVLHRTVTESIKLTYPPTSLAKLGLRTTLDISKAVEEDAL